MKVLRKKKRGKLTRSIQTSRENLRKSWQWNGLNSRSGILQQSPKARPGHQYSAYFTENCHIFMGSYNHVREVEALYSSWSILAILGDLETDVK